MSVPDPNRMATIERLNAFMRRSPFNAWLGCRISQLGDVPGQIEIVLPAREEMRRDDGAAAHGGVVAALIDVAAHASLHAVTGFGMPTIDLRVDYLALAQMPLTAKAAPRRTGRTIGFVDIEVLNAGGQLAATGRAVLLTRPPAS